MEGMLNTKREQVKKDLELQRLHKNYIDALMDLHEALEQQLEKVSDDNEDLWNYIYGLQKSFREYSPYHMDNFINRHERVHLYGKVVQIDYSDLN